MERRQLAKHAPLLDRATELICNTLRLAERVKPSIVTASYLKKVTNTGNFMLSWDDFYKEDLEEEYSNYVHVVRQYGVTRRVISTTTDGDSAAIARAKAALDKLDSVVSNHEQLEARRRIIQLGDYDDDLIRALHGLTSGRHFFYDFHYEHARISAVQAVISRIVAIFAACLLSARACSLATASRNATLRTPLFAYDAELSIVRHRLRVAL
ncbi:hypothetical protein ALO35_200198 [Pseudomonas amygdali pv. lachrymans]|nr:hypothetical protein ALO35_200198 [Pseudomonas amygdali pv. lachrymans]